MHQRGEGATPIRLVTTAEEAAAIRDPGRSPGAGTRHKRSWAVRATPQPLFRPAARRGHPSPRSDLPPAGRRGTHMAPGQARTLRLPGGILITVLALAGTATVDLLRKAAYEADLY